MSRMNETIESQAKTEQPVATTEQPAATPEEQPQQEAQQEEEGISDEASDFIAQTFGFTNAPGASQEEQEQLKGKQPEDEAPNTEAAAAQLGAETTEVKDEEVKATEGEETELAKELREIKDKLAEAQRPTEEVTETPEQQTQQEAIIEEAKALLPHCMPQFGEEVLDKLLSEDRAEALDTLRRVVAAASLQAIAVMRQHVLPKFGEEFAQKQQLQQETTKIRTEFFGAYPALDTPIGQHAVNLAVKQLAQTGAIKDWNPQSSQLIAKTAAELIGSVGEKAQPAQTNGTEVAQQVAANPSAVPGQATVVPAAPVRQQPPYQSGGALPTSNGNSGDDERDLMAQHL